MLSRIRGTRDILDARQLQDVYSKISQYLLCARFCPIQLPILEHVELFQRSLGEGSDAVAKEMYLVKSLHDESEGICLRPEATASTMRAYLLNRPAHSPWRTYTYGSMFRHERPQKGRFREFTQLSIEIVDGASFMYDVELIVLLNTLFNRVLHVDGYELSLNFIGNSLDRKAYMQILLDYINSFDNVPAGILHTAKTNLLRVFDLKDEECRKFMEQAPVITDYLSSESMATWHSVKSELNAAHVVYATNAHLVRGLDYYNNTVFEFTSHHLGSQNTFCGGGRYDVLAKVLGSNQDVPAVGAAIGIDRLALILEGSYKNSDSFVACVSASGEYHSKVFALTSELRESGVCAEYYADKNSLKSAFRKADKDEAEAVLVIGDTECEKNIVTVKNMKTGEQREVKRSEIVKICKNILAKVDW